MFHFLKACHIIAIVCWFAGLFYLPRLYVYHAKTTNQQIKNQFKIMEFKLYYYITTPAAILTIFFGCSLWLNSWHKIHFAWWLQIKLILVACLILFHIMCAKLLHDFRKDNNIFNEKFYRYFNEIPTILLISIVFLSVLR